MKLLGILLFSGLMTACRGNSYSFPPKLLLVSFDGFRADYLQNYEFPHLQNFIKEGVMVEHVKNVFITKTFPNHYSIVTGLYEESHGIVANAMYDVTTKKHFSDLNKDPFWWNEAVPIWVTNELQENRSSAAAMWPGTDIPIHNTTPSYYMNYSSSVSFLDRLNNITMWLSNSNPPVTFAALYWEEPDASGHKYGPEDRGNMSRVLKEIDDLIGNLVYRLKMLGLWENLNVIITSDHGMTQCSKDRLINLDLCISRSDYTLIDLSPVAAILPKRNRTEVYNKLKNCSFHMNVYLKEDIPARFHYQHNDRIQPVILVADEGWTIVLNKSSPKLGDHGYDNSLPSMHPFLAAHGPAFHKGYKHSTVDSVDIYPMMCHILGLKPHPNNGTFGHTKCLLVDQWCIKLPEAIGIVIGALLILTTLTCLFIIMQNRLSVPRPFSRLQLQEDDDDPLIE
ncbi:bis(5'-adenosyl)-triphosphatase ENPP4 isoform X1 [Phyllostomus hastatus]|uniref:bis(5'-adenosyl)-triphosphatase ENPP4 isoform X1 n=1 Tax=Phyllostomus hastatus TaxID=9423 RepID=UPI001E68051D|nr:bis(5'-adenosyl)-triphosphatase ENPP4 isoform X1 [Phyllostomus hastatus]XP_045700122.1 bis(5'-adenosyl)-triphosphatase ENPP4 isoform X1 [Phyllostomus hastatus]XP_045700123.1 bis(5'-adenosyl)-triphosphatase ENPP4 isoform X1 [Phyllostomus hastatus]XP_045700125.1 bis(5'-adenosyl)-triphosphatase ENPP4 isoform X1 [Phyllostomus hastatus]XP_045700126.1 bis(5'-adenosyl)-triphosphatase ENPP4 isoform X1 [Phyllostomus hastatus]